MFGCWLGKKKREKKTEKKCEWSVEWRCMYSTTTEDKYFMFQKIMSIPTWWLYCCYSYSSIAFIYFHFPKCSHFGLMASRGFIWTVQNKNENLFEIWFLENYNNKIIREKEKNCRKSCCCIFLSFFCHKIGEHWIHTHLNTK